MWTGTNDPFPYPRFAISPFLSLSYFTCRCVRTTCCGAIFMKSSDLSTEVCVFHQISSCPLVSWTSTHTRFRDYGSSARLNVFLRLFQYLPLDAPHRLRELTSRFVRFYYFFFFYLYLATFLFLLHRLTIFRSFRQRDHFIFLESRR